MPSYYSRDPQDEKEVPERFIEEAFRYYYDRVMEESINVPTDIRDYVWIEHKKGIEEKSAELYAEYLQNKAEKDFDDWYDREKDRKLEEKREGK